MLKVSLQLKEKQHWGFKVSRLIKGVLAILLVIAYWGLPVFSMDPDLLWPVGRWLSQPHIRKYKGFGVVTVIPWISLANASARYLAQGVFKLQA